MGDSATDALDQAAESVRAAWHELAALQRDQVDVDLLSEDDDRRYITALWRVQGAEEEYHRAQEQRFGR